jgi:hypothetical protein
MILATNLFYQMGVSQLPLPGLIIPYIVITLRHVVFDELIFFQPCRISIPTGHNPHCPHEITMNPPFFEWKQEGISPTILLLIK